MLAGVGRDGGEVFSTLALSKFVTFLAGTAAPVVVDLGQAVGVNVTFLGEHLGCKLHVEDLLSDLETWGPQPPLGDSQPSEGGSSGQEVDRTKNRVLQRATESVDGILCWDVFDYLEADAAGALAGEITRVLKPGGVVFLCHAAEHCQIAGPIQHEIVDDTTLRYRASPRAVPASRVWQSRAVTKMFAELAIMNSFLLTNRMREVVFRKAPASTAVD